MSKRKRYYATGGMREATTLVGVEVITDDGPLHYKLTPRWDLARHSPTGFGWGYAGSGPAQLALAIVADVLQNDEKALRLHQRFKAAVIQHLPEDVGWTLAAVDVLGILADIENGRRAQ